MIPKDPFSRKKNSQKFLRKNFQSICSARFPAPSDLFIKIITTNKANDIVDLQLSISNRSKPEVILIKLFRNKKNWLITPLISVSVVHHKITRLSTGMC